MKTLIIAACLATATLSGCVVAPNSANVYRANEAQNEQSVRMATVESVREITIDKGASGIGKTSGAVLGGLATGSNIGHGNGAAAAAVVGAIAGGIIGDNVEANLTNKKGFEITVKLDNGELRSIVQDADEAFKPGERVRLLSNGKKTRVTH
jgi:outer membrane lipoprotein SlyB